MLSLVLCFIAIASSSSLPNIVIYVADELHADSMGVYGGPALTPNLNRFASEGSLFLNAHTSHTVCTPSRCSFMTGRYVHQGGHRTLWDPLRSYEGNLLRSAKAAGYHVSWFGKNDLLDDVDGSFNLSVSSSTSLGSGDTGPPKYDNISDAAFYSFISDPPAAALNETSDMANALGAVSFVREWIASGEESPWLLYLPLTAPHPPYGCARPFYDMYVNSSTLPPLRPADLPGKPDYHALIRFYRNLTKVDPSIFLELQALYYGCISYSDAVFGALFDGLRDLGVWNETAVFVMADHGDYFGNMELVEKWPSGLEDLLTHVPFIAKVPGGAPGQVFSGLIQSMDLTPTILEMMNVTANWTYSAVSQYQKLLGSGTDDLERSVFAEGGYATYEPNSFEGRCDDPLQPGICDPTQIYYPKGYQEWHNKLSVCRSTAMITPLYKLVRRSDPTSVDHFSEMYDLTADPHELNNIYGLPQYAAIQSNLTIQMLNWYVQTSDVTPFDEQSRSTPSQNWTTAEAAAASLDDGGAQWKSLQLQGMKRGTRELYEERVRTGTREDSHFAPTRKTVFGEGTH